MLTHFAVCVCVIIARIHLGSRPISPTASFMCSPPGRPPSARLLLPWQGSPFRWNDTGYKFPRNIATSWFARWCQVFLVVATMYGVFLPALLRQCDGQQVVEYIGFVNYKACLDTQGASPVIELHTSHTSTDTSHGNGLADPLAAKDLELHTTLASPRSTETFVMASDAGSSFSSSCSSRPLADQVQELQ